CIPAVESRALVLNSHLRQEEGVIKRRFMQTVVAAGSAAVSGGVHVGFQDDQIVVSAKRAHFGDVLGGLPIHDLTVVERSPHQHVGICFVHNVVVGGIGHHVFE